MTAVVVVEGPGGLTASGPPNWSVDRSAGDPDWGRASWSTGESSLRVRTSEFGWPGVFALVGRGSVAMATNPDDLARSYGLAVDPVGLLQALAFGHPLGTRTVRMGVQALVPGSRLDWVAGGVPDIVGPEIIPAAGETPKRVFAEIDGLVRSSLRRIRADAFVTMGLSGGHDSRHLLAASASLGRLPDLAVVSGHYLPSSGADLDLARRVGDRFGLLLAEGWPLPDRWTAEAVKTGRIGLGVLAHSWATPLGTVLGRGDVVLDGMNAGVLFGRSSWVRRARQEFGPARPPWVALRRFIERRFASALSEQRVWWPEVLDGTTFTVALEEALASFDRFEDFANPVQAWWYHEHVSRETARMSLGMVDAPSICAPFDTPDVVRLAFALPWAETSDPGFQRRMLDSCYPDLADLGTTENTWSGVAAPISEALEEASYGLVDTGGPTPMTGTRPTELADIQKSYLVGRLMEANT